MKTIGYWSLIETSKPVIERTSKTKEHKTRFLGMLIIECQKRLLAMSFITFNDVCKNI